MQQKAFRDDTIDKSCFHKKARWFEEGEEEEKRERREVS